MSDGPDPAALPGQTIVYRLGREFRRPVLARFIVYACLTVVLAFGIAVLHGLADVLCCLTGLVALCSGVGYVWQGRFATVVTSDGILVRGYFNRFVPWSEVSGIELGGYGSQRTRLDSPSLRHLVDQRRGYPGGRRTTPWSLTSGKLARLSTVRVVRANGRNVLLRAPRVTGWAADSDFTDKARQLQELCTHYAGPAELRPTRPRR
jgi:hypothetical protein